MNRNSYETGPVNHRVGASRETLRVPSPWEVMVNLVETLADWQKRHNERVALRDMSAAMRRDIGLGDDDIARELAKPFWRS